MAFTESDIAKVKDIDSLILVSHSMMVSKGWWDDGIASRLMSDITNNFHAEVSEAWEEYRSGRFNTWYRNPGLLNEGSLPKPEGFFVEISDLILRITDAVGAHRIVLGETYDWNSKVSISAFIADLHFLIDEDHYGQAVHVCFQFADTMRHDLWATIREKMAYNATRPHRHGGKLA